jgi:NOL1/NOP2/fmu family ribosome biogenesis protein
MKLLNNPDKKKIINQLNNQFGISKLPYLLLQFGKEKFRLFSGSLSKEDLNLLDRELIIENIGLYFAKQQNDGLRLTLDSLSVFKNQTNKNILEINNKQAENWLKGNDLYIISDNNFKILKHNNELIGCGKSTGERITNSIPKERRIKS